MIYIYSMGHCNCVAAPGFYNGVGIHYCDVNITCMYYGPILLIQPPYHTSRMRLTIMFIMIQAHT